MKKVTIILFLAAIGLSYLVGTKQTKNTVPNHYIDTRSQEFHDHFVDMREVANIIDSDCGTMIILKNGEGYYWER